MKQGEALMIIHYNDERDEGRTMDYFKSEPIVWLRKDRIDTARG